MSDINDLLRSSSPVLGPAGVSAGSQEPDTGGFSGFIIRVFAGIQVVTFFLTWLLTSIFFFVTRLLVAVLFGWMRSGQDATGGSGTEGFAFVLALVVSIGAGFLVAIWTHGLIAVMLDTRRQLIEIRRQLARR